MLAFNPLQAGRLKKLNSNKEPIGTLAELLFIDSFLLLFRGMSQYRNVESRKAEASLGFPLPNSLAAIVGTPKNIVTIGLNWKNLT